MERLAAMPGMGGRYESDNLELAGVRVFPVSRIRNYLIFYRPTPQGIEVLRVLHGARDIDRVLGMYTGAETEHEEPEQNERNDQGPS